MPLSKTYNQDCLEAMREMADKSFDLAIVDPPYGIGADKRNAISTIRDNPQWANVNWDLQTPTENYFDELFRVSANQIIFGANYFIDKIKRPTSGMIIWDKTVRGITMADCEIAWSSFKRPARIYTEVMGFLKRIHPTQKSTKLYKWLLINYAKQGDTILDTHLGSGSSRIAAYDLGFDFAAYELDKDYFEAQENRFAEHIKQPKLFEIVSEKPTQHTLFLER